MAANLAYGETSEDSTSENSTCNRSCSRNTLEPNSDVGGVGVLIGFVATAWLVVLLVIIRYCLAFDPTADPLANSERDRKRTSRHAFKPNPVDVKTIDMFSGLRRRLGHHSHWHMALTKMFLTLCDVQILTGFGLLFSSFVGLTCYMSAYHWQIISYLAWFSNLTHAACLTALREYLYHHKMERNFRMMLMIVLMAGLITAIVPTGYFDWGDLDDKYIIWDQGTAGVPASNARCFFSQRKIQSMWESRLCKDDNQLDNADDGYQCNRKQHYSGGKLTPLATTAYESSILSIILLTFSFSSRSIKMFRTLSYIVKNTIRRKIGYCAASCLIATAKGYRQFGTTVLRRKLLAVFRPLDLMIGLYLVAKMYLDVLSSELADLFWLFVSSIWGTSRLFMARKSADVHGAENEWGFGQVLAVFLLLGPITMVLLAVCATIRGQKKLKKQDEDEDPIRRAVSLLAAYQAEMISTQRINIGGLHRVLSMLRDIESQSRITSATRRRSSAQVELDAVPLDELQQFPENGAGADASALFNSLHSPPILSGTNSGIVTLPNQDTITETENVDIRESLSFRFLQSRWMTIVMWLTCFQISLVVFIMFGYLLLGPYGPNGLLTPSMLFKGALVTILFVQPLNSFVVVMLGLYVHDDRLSKVQLTLLWTLVLSLLGWSIFTVIPHTLDYYSWYYWVLAPMVTTTVQFMYLNFR